MWHHGLPSLFHDLKIYEWKDLTDLILRTIIVFWRRSIFRENTNLSFPPWTGVSQRKGKYWLPGSSMWPPQCMALHLYIYFDRHDCHQIWQKRLDRLDKICLQHVVWTAHHVEDGPSLSGCQTELISSIQSHPSFHYIALIRPSCRYDISEIHNIRSVPFGSILLVPPLCCQKARTYSQGTRQSQWKPRVTKTLP